MLRFWFFFCIIKDSPAPISLRMWKQEEDKLMQQLGNNRPFTTDPGSAQGFRLLEGIFPPCRLHWACLEGNRRACSRPPPPSRTPLRKLCYRATKVKGEYFRFSVFFWYVRPMFSKYKYVQICNPRWAWTSSAGRVHCAPLSTYSAQQQLVAAHTHSFPWKCSGSSHQMKEVVEVEKM